MKTLCSVRLYACCDFAQHRTAARLCDRPVNRRPFRARASGPGCLGFGWRDVADGFEQVMVVEPRDPLQCRHLDRFARLPRPSLVNDLGLVQPFNGLGQRDFVAVAGGADRWLDASFGQPFGVSGTRRTGLRGRGHFATARAPRQRDSTGCGRASAPAETGHRQTYWLRRSPPTNNGHTTPHPSIMWRSPGGMIQHAITNQSDTLNPPTMASQLAHTTGTAAERPGACAQAPR